MRPKVLVRKEVFVFLVIVIASYAVSLVLFLFLDPAPFANILGFLSLLSYTATIIPSIIKVVFPAIQRTKALKLLLKNRRNTGVAAFSFGLNHSVLLTNEIKLDWLKYDTYIHASHGISILLIFTILAFTSNNWSAKQLKGNWKKLHSLTYLVIFLLPWHIWVRMGGHWSHITPFALLLTIVTAILFISRRWIEQLEARSKQINQPETKLLGDK